MKKWMAMAAALAFSGRPVDEIDSVVELFVW